MPDHTAEKLAVRNELIEVLAGSEPDPAELMRTLHRFDVLSAYEVDGDPSTVAWADRIDRGELGPRLRGKLTRHTAKGLLFVFRTYCCTGGLDVDKVAAAGWTKVRIFSRAVRLGLISCSDVILACERYAAPRLREIRDELLAEYPSGAFWDVRIPVLDSDGAPLETANHGPAYLHRRVRASSQQEAEELALEDYGSEDLFGIRFGDPDVRRL